MSFAQVIKNEKMDDDAAINFGCVSDVNDNIRQFLDEKVGNSRGVQNYRGLQLRDQASCVFQWVRADMKALYRTTATVSNRQYLLFYA